MGPRIGDKVFAGNVDGAVRWSRSAGTPPLGICRRRQGSGNEKGRDTSGHRGDGARGWI